MRGKCLRTWCGVEYLMEIGARGREGEEEGEERMVWGYWGGEDGVGDVYVMIGGVAPFAERER